MTSATPGKFAHLFVKQSALYKDFRPRYPPALFKEIFQFAFGNPDGPVREPPSGASGSSPRSRSTNSGRQTVAVDVATGNGQALDGLIPVFDKIYALDASENQVAHATSYPNVEYKVADAHSMGLPDASVDLVTVGQALHWFELPAFYREVRRVLRPGGTMAAWCYDLGTVGGDANNEASKVLYDLYEAQLGPFWSDRRRLVEQAYEGSEPGVGTDFGTVKKVDLTMVTELSLEGMVGYCKSWSSYQTFRSQHPDRPDPIIKFTDDLQRALLSTSNSTGSGASNSNGSGGANGSTAARTSNAPTGSAAAGTAGTAETAAEGASLAPMQLVRKLTLMLAKDPTPVT